MSREEEIRAKALEIAAVIYGETGSGWEEEKAKGVLTDYLPHCYGYFFHDAASWAGSRFWIIRSIWGPRTGSVMASITVRRKGPFPYPLSNVNFSHRSRKSVGMGIFIDTSSTPSVIVFYLLLPKMYPVMGYLSTTFLQKNENNSKNFRKSV
jgi:hypothetical protein